MKQSSQGKIAILEQYCAKHGITERWRIIVNPHQLLKKPRGKYNRDRSWGRSKLRHLKALQVPGYFTDNDIILFLEKEFPGAKITITESSKLSSKIKRILASLQQRILS